MIKLIVNKVVHPVTFMNFSAGESFVKLDVDIPRNSDSVVIWNYENDGEIMYLMQLLSLVERKCNSIIKLVIPYFPHSRQDRFSTTLQPFSLNNMFEILGTCDNVSIYTLDMHSDVYKSACKGSFVNVKSDQLFADYIKEFCAFCNYEYDYVCSPDKGARQRALDWAVALNKPLFIADKTRDPATGKLGTPIIPNMDLKGKRILIVDDICDGGGTFVLLGQELKKFEPLSIDLFVSHGIFAKGFEPFDGVITTIFTTDSVLKTNLSQANVIHLEEYLDDMLSAR